jgi:hypothetical protein
MSEIKRNLDGWVTEVSAAKRNVPYAALCSTMSIHRWIGEVVVRTPEVRFESVKGSFLIPAHTELTIRVWATPARPTDGSPGCARIANPTRLVVVAAEVSGGEIMRILGNGATGLAVGFHRVQWRPGLNGPRVLIDEKDLELSGRNGPNAFPKNKAGQVAKLASMLQGMRRQELYGDGTPYKRALTVETPKGMQVNFTKEAVAQLAPFTNAVILGRFRHAHNDPVLIDAYRIMQQGEEQFGLPAGGLEGEIENKLADIYQRFASSFRAIQPLLDFGPLFGQSPTPSHATEILKEINAPVYGSSDPVVNRATASLVASTLGGELRHDPDLDVLDSTPFLVAGLYFSSQPPRQWLRAVKSQWARAGQAPEASGIDAFLDWLGRFAGK